jgi:FAD-linked sulfhydryl oxidase
MPRRQHVTIFTIIAVAAFLTFSFWWTFRTHGVPPSDADTKYPSSAIPQEPVLIDDGILRGAATAPKLENATLKYVPLSLRS